MNHTKHLFGRMAVVLLVLFVVSVGDVESAKKKPEASQRGSVISDTKRELPPTLSPSDVLSASTVVSASTIQSTTAPYTKQDSILSAIKSTYSSGQPDGRGSAPSVGDLVAETDGQSTAKVLGRMLMSLAVVILLLLFFAYLVKRNFSKKHTLGGGYIDILGSFALSQKSQIHLVRVGMDHYLLGEGGQSVSLISKVDLQLDEQTSSSSESTPSVQSSKQIDVPSLTETASFDERLSQWQNAIDDQNIDQEVNASLLLLQGLSQRLKRKEEKDA